MPSPKYAKSGLPRYAKGNTAIVVEKAATSGGSARVRMRPQTVTPMPAKSSKPRASNLRRLRFRASRCTEMSSAAEACSGSPLVGARRRSGWATLSWGPAADASVAWPFAAGADCGRARTDAMTAHVSGAGSTSYSCHSRRANSSYA
jgi:hypothetical protein